MSGYKKEARRERALALDAARKKREEDALRANRAYWLARVEDSGYLAEKDGDWLEEVPEDLKTAELCLAAVSKTGTALEWVPEELKTPELCMIAVTTQDGPSYGKYYPLAIIGTVWALQSVPDRLKTPELCMAAVKQNGRALSYVPEALKTEELCLAALQQDGRALLSVPDNLMTAEFCLAVVKNDAWAAQHVPENLRTAEISQAAVQGFSAAVERCVSHVDTEDWLEYITELPKNILAAELCLAAVKQNDEALQYVPEELKAQVMEAVANLKMNDGDPDDK
jgi:hypothetical protein